MTGTRFPGEAREVSLLHCIQNVFPATHPPIKLLVGIFLGGIKLLERDTDFSLQSGAEVKNIGAILSV
jgi:hypothetical protein